MLERVTVVARGMPQEGGQKEGELHVAMEGNDKNEDEEHACVEFSNFWRHVVLLSFKSCAA